MSNHRVARIAAGSVLALALAATPALAGGSPLTHDSYPAADLNIDGPICGYTFTSGSLTIVYRTADAYPGEIWAAHLTLRDIWATKDDTSFRVLGTETYTDTGRLNIKLFFVESGSGLADSVNVVFRTWADGSWHFGFERDSCHLYG